MKEIMKNRFIAGLAVLALTFSGVLSIGALAQTTQEGPAPSDQPSAPMEIGQQGPVNPNQGQSQVGQGQIGQDQGGPQMSPGDAQPTEAEPGGPSGEAPATTDQGVGRVSLMHGDVSTQRGDSGDWSAAILNQPVMTGDKVTTGDAARTELQLDFANTLRLGPNTKATISNLTKKDIQILLGEGIANYTTSKDSEAEPEIDTPNVAVHPSHHDGVFRIEVRPDGDTVVIVRQGEAQISTPQGSTEIHSGDMATVRGDASAAQYKISPAPDRDDWDRWNSDRDHMIRNASSWKHTNRYYTGTQDLDASGRWQNVPDYGDVWVPNEPDGWAPYRDGNWTYQPYYGWTWVGYEPWGWAPYHYGRWFPYGGAWAWWPGPVYGGGFYRPFWSPAYVSFWGWGGGFGFGFGFGGWGGFGWLPIGPCDYFHPWWGGYRGRFGVVGFHGGINHYGGFAPLHGGTRFSNIANIHDAHVSRGLSTVNAGHFGAGRVTAMAATRQQINGARMMAGNLPVVPSRASLSASGRAAAPSTVRNGSQHFFGSVHNNLARPASFSQQTASLRQTMQQNHVGAVPAGGRFGGESTARGAAGSGTGVSGTASSNLQRPSAGTISNRETNNPGNNAGNRTAGNQPSSAENGSRGGYRPFTPPSSDNRSSSPVNSERPNPGTSGAGSRTMGSQTMEPQRGVTQSAPAANRDGFRPFTPPSSSEGARAGSSAPEARGSSGGYWNRTAPSSAPSQSMGRGSPNSGSYGRGSYSRPQLDMRQPIARSPYGSSRGGYGGAPSYRAPSYHAPSYGGSHSAPPSHSSGGGGGHVSAPSGGHSSGGGGGGGHSGGGHH